LESKKSSSKAKKLVPGAIMSSISPVSSLPDLEGPYSNQNQQQSRMDEYIVSLRSQRSNGSVSSSI
jgi:hypothetical protein